MLKHIDDYSGEFLPDLKMGNFSPDTLVNLLTLYSKLFIALDGFWYLTVKGKVSNEVALACDIGAWERVCRYSMAQITKTLDIKGNDVTALMKAIQITPWYRNNKHEIRIRNQNNAILTITSCPTLDALEKEGKGREEEICNIFCPKLFEWYASYFDSGIDVKCLKTPPRNSKEEICCKWEFAGPK